MLSHASALDRNTALGGICSGDNLLARAGLLDGYQCTQEMLIHCAVITTCLLNPWQRVSKQC